MVKPSSLALTLTALLTTLPSSSHCYFYSAAASRSVLRAQHLAALKPRSSAVLPVFLCLFQGQVAGFHSSAANMSSSSTAATTATTTTNFASSIHAPQSKDNDADTKGNTNETGTAPSTPLALPPAPSTTEEKARQLDVSKEGQTVRLDALGPMVVNVDGTLSRISNWEGMTELERKNTGRVIGKRNRERLARLKEAEGAERKEEL